MQAIFTMITNTSQGSHWCGRSAWKILWCDQDYHWLRLSRQMASETHREKWFTLHECCSFGPTYNPSFTLSVLNTLK